MQSKWSLKNIILMTLTALICGVIYWLISFLYTFCSAVLTPLGLAPMDNDLTQGPWILSGTLIGVLFQMPGSAFFGQLLSSIIETFIGDKGGILDSVSGIFDGIGTELGFLIFGYRHYNHLTLFVTSLLTTITTFGYSWIFDGYRYLTLPLLAVLFIVRFISIFVVSYFLTLGIVKLLKRAGALDLIGR